MTSHQPDRARLVPGAQPPRLTLPFVEFVGLIACMMALTALSIDIMLPALPHIGQALGLASENEQQLVVIVYVAGFAAGQLFYGPLSDRWGRRPVLLIGFAIFIAGSLAALAAPTFGALLMARVLQGIGAASPRVVGFAVVRDLFTGRQMARVVSLAMMVFIVVPVLAPSLGQLLMSVGNWRTPFDALLIFGVAVAAWVTFRLPETRVALDAAERKVSAWQSALTVLSSRQTLGYMICTGFMFGCLMGYVASYQQVFVDVYQLGPMFPVAFGAIASVMALASFVNAQLVEQLGMRLVSHTALAIFMAAAVMLVLAAAIAGPPLWSFALLVSVCFFCFGLMQPNFNALAMEPHGRHAGMASSLVGFYSTGAGALIGGLIGHLFGGSVMPLAAGFLACSVSTALVIAAVEGRSGLFGRNRSA